MDEEFKNQEHIDELRRRLYERSPNNDTPIRHELSDTKIDVARDWGTASSVNSSENEDIVVPPVQKPKHRYRLFVLLGSLLIFIIAAAISSAYLYFGGNQISSENIELTIGGPNNIGGGEVASLQVGLTNQNAVGLESVTLILRFPSGSQTTEEPIENLFEKRIWIDSLSPGEVKNIPVQARIFGEEGDQKEVQATLEYRLSGSNGTFYKDADPLTFQIISTPVVVEVKSIEKVASGQEVEVEIDVRSNSSSAFNNLLVSASYPNGFSFKSSDPEPVYGQNVWRIAELKPEEVKKIKLRGTVRGLTDEALRLNVSVGPAQPNNQYIVGATLNEAYTEFVIERPFLDVSVEVAGEDSDLVVLDSGQTAVVVIDIHNTLDESVYDMVVEVVPKGNALNKDSVDGGRGYFDSNTGTIRWETSNVSNFSQVIPDDRRTINFTILPTSDQSTASLDFDVNIYGRRVAERSAQEQLVGTKVVEVRYSSNVGLSNGVALASGPVPPVVGEETVYTITLEAEAGVNDMTNAVVKTSLPVYVEWLDNYATDGSVVYNSVSQELEWRVGNVDGGQKKKLLFTVGLKPSRSQLDTEPILVNSQTLEAKDRFTGATLETDAKFITTEVSGYGQNSGEVVEN